MFLTREQAIERIKFISGLIVENKIEEIINNTSETLNISYINLPRVTDLANDLIKAPLEECLDSYLEEVINLPFYRFKNNEYIRIDNE